VQNLPISSNKRKQLSPYSGSGASPRVLRRRRLLQWRTEALQRCEEIERLWNEAFPHHSFDSGRLVPEELPQDPLTTESWRRAAAEYHRARGNRVLAVETPPEKIARLRQMIADPRISLEAAQAEMMRERPTPQVVIEAIMLAVREGSVAALDEPETAERLGRCDDAAKAQINRRIAKITSKKEGANK
jgi:hypothetical protein